MAARLHAVECLRPARIELEGADCIGFTGGFRAVRPPLPGRADAADEIERGVELRRQLDRSLTVADAEFVVVHGCYRRLAAIHRSRDVAGFTASMQERRRQSRSMKGRRVGGCPLRACDFLLNV